MRRLVCVGVLVVVLVGTAVAPTVAQEAPSEDGGGFVDIEGNPHEEDIRFIVKRRLTVGCDLDGPRYCPDSPVTRAQMAAFLVRALRLDTTVPFLGVYSDVEEGAWYTRFVEALGAHGLTDTQVSGSYRPYDPMLRSEMALFLQKAFRLPLSDEASASSFQDIPADATYAAAAEAVREAGITRGCGVDPLRYCPDGTVKRDTMAAFLARALRTSDLRRVLALAPGRETLRAGTVGAHTWKVWVCDNAPIREDPVVYLNREISSYYQWLSGREYRMRFEYGTDPTPEVSEVLDNCENKDHWNLTPAGNNIFLGSDLWTLASGVGGVGSGWFDPQSQQFSRNVWVDKRSLYDTTLYAHEIGHTFGWPHNLSGTGASEPLQTRMDIMASLGQVIGTNAHNLFQLGWIDPEKVALHSAGAATYTITPPHSGGDLELLMLPLGPDRLISIGARVKEGLDKNILKEGVELYEIALCDGNPGCKHVYLPPGARSKDPVVLNVGDSWTARVTTTPEGRHSQTLDIKVSVTDRQNRSYTLNVAQTTVKEDEVSWITVGNGGTCTLLTSGAAFCSSGDTVRSVPEGTFTSLSVGSYACGTKTEGIIECWGGWYEGITTPSEEFTSVSVTDRHACALRKDRTVACWGLAGDSEPVVQPPDGDFISVTPGLSHACGIRVDQTVQCWGRNRDGADLAPPPQGVVAAISSGYEFSCGLRPDKGLACWSARRGYGWWQPPPGQYIFVEAGWNDACAIRTDGTATCWGHGGQVDFTPPEGIFTAVSVGYSRACGLRPDHTVECWGRQR